MATKEKPMCKTVAVLSTIVLVLNGICWGEEDLTIPEKFPAKFNLAPAQAQLEVFGLRVIVEIKETHANGTIKKMGLAIMYPVGSPREAVQLAQDQKMNLGETAIFTARFNWQVAQTKPEGGKQELESRIIKAFVRQIKEDALSPRLVDYLPKELRTRVQAEMGQELA